MMTPAKLVGSDYFLNLAGDYYQSGLEPPGRWMSLGAAAEGLTGQVNKEAFRQLVEGRSPDGRKQVQNAASKKRQTGWDMCFSVPKTISVFWSQAKPAVRGEIEAAHNAAIKAALHHFEKHYAWTRRGHGGVNWERAGVVAAAFEHSSSRALDAQLHTHLLVLNYAVRADGSVGSLVSRPIYVNKLLLGALYRAELAVQLQHRLGLELERKGVFFRIANVPDALVRRFSTRRRQIEAVAEQRGIYSAAGMEAVTLATRKAKSALSREELFIKWHAIGEQYGFTAREVDALIGRMLTVTPGDPEALFRTATEEILQCESHFSRAELLRRAAEMAPGTGLDAAALEEGMELFLTTAPEIVMVHEDRFTTLAVAREEQSLKDMAQAMQQDGHHTLSEAIVTRAVKSLERRETRRLGKPFKLTAEQRAAVEHITQTDGDLKLVNGVAGSGKSTLLDAARLAWEAKGFTVLGAALSAKAARGLEEGSHIASCTLRRLEMDLSHHWSKDLGHHARQLVRAAQGKPTYKPFDRRSLNRNTIVVVDEASMIGSQMLGALVEAVTRAGAKLVLLGDVDQLPAIDRGAPFRFLLQMLPKHARLTEIIRQREEWGQEAVRQFARGEAGPALVEFQQRGLLHIAADRFAAMEKLIADWASVGVTRPREALIFTATQLERSVLNRMAQQARLRAGMLDRNVVQVGGNDFHEGDRIMFTKNSLRYGVDNGTMGTVLVTDTFRRKLTVVLDAEPGKKARQVTFSSREFTDIDLAYCITTHKGQGMTVMRAFLLAGGAMANRALTYVQASRARLETRIYCDEYEAGPKLATLIRSMNRSVLKENAILPEPIENAVLPKPEKNSVTPEPKVNTNLSVAPKRRIAPSL